MSNDSPPITELFASIVSWAEARGAVKINELPGCWESDWTFDEMPALVSINGHSEDKKSREGFDVPPFNALIMINGWPAVLCSPTGGSIMGGEPDTEERLIRALTATDPTP